MIEELNSFVSSLVDDEYLDGITHNKRKNGHSFKLYSRLLFALDDNSDNHLLLKFPFIDLIDCNVFSVDGTIKSNNMIQFEFTDFNAILVFLNINKDVIKRRINAIAESYGIKNTFGCCSKMMECSLAGHCINLNKSLSKRCYYKTVLDRGEVYLPKSYRNEITEK